MKKVFQIKLKSLTRVFAMVMALSLVTFTGCKTYDADIDQLNSDLAGLKTELTDLNNQTKNTLTALITSTQNALNLQITTLTGEINTLKARLTSMEQNGATKAELEAVKSEILNKTVSLTAFTEYKTAVDKELDALKLKVDAAATKAELAALQLEVGKAATKAELNEVKDMLILHIGNLNTSLDQLQKDLLALQAAGATDAELAAVKTEILNATVSLTTFNTYKALIEGELAGLKTAVGNAATKDALNALQTDINGKIDGLNSDLAALLLRLKALEENGATKAEVAAAIAAVKQEILAVTVSITEYNDNKAVVESKLAELKALIDKAATKDELKALAEQTKESLNALAEQTKESLNALADRLDSKVVEIETSITALGGRVTTLEGGLVTTNETLKNLGDLVDEAILRLDAEDVNLANTIGQLDARVVLLEGILEVAEGKSAVIEDIKSKLTTQLGLIEANTAKIEKLLEDLGTLVSKVDLLQAQVNTNTANIAKNAGDIAQNTTDIATNTAAIAANTLAIAGNTTAIGENAAHITTLFSNVEGIDKAINDLSKELAVVNASMKVLANAIHLNFEALSNRLSSLTYVPTFHVNGIPAVNFSPLIAKCDTVQPTVVMSYHLNPSFIQPEDIETNNLAFAVIKSSNMITGYYSAPADIQQFRAKYVDIDDGKIYVSVKVEDYLSLIESTTNGGPNVGPMESFKMIALMVPLSEKAVKENALEFDEKGGVTIVNDTEYPTSRVITGEYVRLYAEELWARNLNISRKDVAGYPVYSKTVAEAKALSVKGVRADGALPADPPATTTDPLVVTLPYGKTLNLIDHVIPTMFGSEFPKDDYEGLNFKFDVLQANGIDSIVYRRGDNHTNQQQFINVSDSAKGTINAKTFSIPEIIASQGRTPIVRVVLYTNDPYCPVSMAFIKILIAEKPKPKPLEIVFDLGTSVGPCENYTKRLTVQEMNEIVYTKAGLSKQDFHAIYTNFTATGDPNLAQVYNPDGEQTDTYLLRWILTRARIWNRLKTDNPAYFEAIGTYTSVISSERDVIIKFTKTFTRPETFNIDKADLISNYWYGDYTYVKHNIVVPVVNQTTPPVLGGFINNINQAFEQTADKKLNVGLGNYDYFFWSDTIGDIPNGNMTLADGTILRVSPNGKILMFVDENDNENHVAWFNPYATNVGDVLLLNVQSPKAKELLNKGTEFLKARIGIRTTLCDVKDPIVSNVTINGKDYFDVVFVRPINPQPATDQYFVDALNLGDKYTYLEITKLTNLNDWRFPNAVASFATHANYWSYYGVTNITANVANIKTDLNQAAGVKVPVTNYPDLKVAYAATVPGVTPPTTNFFGYLTYDNTGNTLGELFNLYVPVTITYSWGTIQAAEVVVPVKKTVGQSGIKRK